MKSINKIVLKDNTVSIIQTTIILAVLMTVAVICSNGVFIQPNNLVNLIKQNTILVFVTLAQMLIIMTGGIDLSVGAVSALSSVLFVLFQGYSIAMAIMISLVAGLIIGIINGCLVTYIKLPPFVVTLAMMQIVYSISKVMTNGAKIEHSINKAMLFQSVSQFFKGNFLGVPNPICICICLTILLALYMRTKIGYFIYAIGGNINTARISGLPVNLISTSTYALASSLAAAAGILFVTRVSTGDPDSGKWLGLDSIAACLIGGVSLSGGKGTVIGTIMGLFTLAVLNNVMSLLHISPDAQPIVKGIVILIAVYFNNMKRKGEQ